MVATILKELWKNEYVKTAIMFILIIVIVFGLWYSSQLILNTQYPALAVATGSMCEVEYIGCDGWTHPFQRTLHVGDLIIVQGVNPKDIKTNYSTGDIIVFHEPRSSEQVHDKLIVHRAIANVTREVNGQNVTYFVTRGDGSPTQSGDYWQLDYRKDYSWNGMISEKLVVGKVLLRVPWIGHVALYMHNNVSGMFIIVLLLIILIIAEFVIPAFTDKKSDSREGAKNLLETSLYKGYLSIQ